MKVTFGGLLMFLFCACGDDGHVVGDMGSGGSAASEDSSSTNSDSGSSSSGSGTDSRTTTGSNSGSDGSSGTSDSTTGSDGSGGTSSTGGSDSGSGGTAGDATSGSGGTANGGTGASGGSGGTAGAGGMCPDGQMWCPGCYEGEGSCGVACPGSQCADCSYEDTEEDCARRVDCHPVYTDPGDCFCSMPGCCAQFSSCASGVDADCEGPATSCAMPGPYCETPTFVVSYAGGCFEGCVKPEDCLGGGVCPCPDCADGEEMCLQDAECVLASGPTGNGICRSGSDGTCGTCKCTSPDTPIATLDGNRAIRELGVGDYVYSVHHGSIDLVPVKRINRIPVVNHHVLRVEFESGAKFEMSATHPTASGRPLSAFGVGDELLGERIARVTRIAYQHSHTYDILPDSDTGTYFADGVLVGSTLFGR